MKYFCRFLYTLMYMVLVSPCILFGAEHGRPIPLRLALYDLAFECDCYFTFECFVKNETQSTCEFLNPYVSPPRCRTTEDAIVWLRKVFPGFTIQRARPDSVIIRLIDSRLEKMNKYALDETISMQYAGGAQDYVSSIGSNLDGRIVSPGSYIAGFGLTGPDGKTRLRIPRTRCGIRDLLTDYIPLSRYTRLIWTSRSFALSNGSLISEVHFSGQRCGSFQSTRKHPLDYTFGEEAFEVNCKHFSRFGSNKEASNSAAEFITSRITNPNSTHIRWAMLYLGHCRTVDNVPLLLKYIDYHYTSCQIVEESYPAVQALLLIGSPASTAALAVLCDRQSDLRLRLLSHTILCIDGTDKGKGRIEEVLANVKDDAQTKRIQAALNQALLEYRQQSE